MPRVTHISAYGDATTFEVAPRVISRVASPEMYEYHYDVHKASGVILMLGFTAAAILDRDGRGFGVELADGQIVPCDPIVTTPGVVPTPIPPPRLGAAVRADSSIRVTASSVSSASHFAELEMANSPADHMAARKLPAPGPTATLANVEAVSASLKEFAVNPKRPT